MLQVKLNGRESAISITARISVFMLFCPFTTVCQ